MIIRPEAEADLADAREWYERQREGLSVTSPWIAWEKPLRKSSGCPRCLG